MVKFQDRKYLMFSLDNKDYGIPIIQVSEIIGIMDITYVPQTPKFIKGVINLRGKIIPVMDLRLKFEMPEKEYTEETCIIITEVKIREKDCLMGLLVDVVSEVVNISGSDIEPPPEYGEESSSELLEGIGKVKDRVVMLLQIEKIINCHEVIKFMDKALKEEKIEPSTK